MNGARATGRAPTNHDIMRRLEALARSFEHSEQDRASHREAQAESLRRLTESTGDTAEAIKQIEHKLGEEPNSDGSGGRGLIGDLRKTSRDVSALMDLRRTALGFVAAVTLFGAMIVLGATHWIEGVVKGIKS